MTWLRSQNSCPCCRRQLHDTKKNQGSSNSNIQLDTVTNGDDIVPYNHSQNTSASIAALPTLQQLNQHSSITAFDLESSDTSDDSEDIIDESEFQNFNNDDELDWAYDQTPQSLSGNSNTVSSLGASEIV